ncbi:hypothetical protein [Aquamicrobium sp.]|uniref:hypothetical protein n=1 Tax=Aquamicrobium sp. TaxID=1872579 RepID=UPI0025851C55|nr:hypothetical protein [Aquamicrobium sp.]MCK9549160.1 hypothetical protein [Aquamicrobium sp.]
MHAICLKESKSVPVKYLRARCGVRYWEDGTVNGEEDADGSRIPCREGTAADNDHFGGGNWRPVIDLDTGKIEGWPEGTIASIHYKVCDDGDYELLDEERNVVKAIDGYVPSIMCPEGQGHGDYVIMEIAADGTIANWRADLSDFEEYTCT